MQDHRACSWVDPTESTQGRKISPKVSKPAAKLVEKSSGAIRVLFADDQVTVQLFARTIFERSFDRRIRPSVRFVRPTRSKRSRLFVEHRIIVFTSEIPLASARFPPQLSHRHPADQPIGFVVEKSAEIPRWRAVVPRLGANLRQKPVFQPEPKFADRVQLEEIFAEEVTEMINMIKSVR